MTLFRRVINSQLPTFAQPDNPLMRHALVRSQRHSRRVWQWLRWLGIVAVLMGLIALGYEIATNFGTTPLPEWVNQLDRVYLVLHWPLVILQLGAQIAAIAATTGVIAAEARHGTWET